MVRRRLSRPLKERKKKVEAQSAEPEEWCDCGAYKTPRQLADDWGWDYLPDDKGRGEYYEHRATGRRAKWKVVWALKWGHPEEE